MPPDELGEKPNFLFETVENDVMFFSKQPVQSVKAL